MARFVEVWATPDVQAHARRLGLTPKELTTALFVHAAQMLAEWTEEQEAADPGSVWQTGDVPEWLEAYLPQREGF